MGVPRHFSRGDKIFLSEYIGRPIFRSLLFSLEILPIAVEKKLFQFPGEASAPSCPPLGRQCQ